MKKVKSGAIKVYESHDARRKKDIPREEIGEHGIRKNAEEAIGDGFDQRAPVLLVGF